MYSLVLMAALTNNAAVPTASPEEAFQNTRAVTAVANRCHGCCGGGRGCHGGRRGHGCCGGGYGCCGGGGWGCCGGGGCYGGGYGCCGGGGYAAPAMMAPAVPKAPPAKKEMPEEKGETSSQALIVVSLPADAKLTVDGAATSSTSAQRSFVSPPLEQGKEYVYTLKATVVRDGQTLESSKRVSVRPGAESRVQIDFNGAQVVSR
jgi:uncharacterized protein (TIGR03000 family)